jgi:hypothetical protein
MKGDFSALEKWARGMERMEKRMDAGADEVLAANEAKYLGIARQASLQFLLAIPNDEVDREVWAQRVDDFVELILSRMAGNALEIFYQGRGEDDSKPKGPVNITYDDVLNWVKAGPEQGGKDKTVLEQEKNYTDMRADEHIAYNVYEAIVQYRLGLSVNKDYGPITERLERWIQYGESGNQFLELLPDLLAVWENLLGPVMERDLDAWVDKLVAEF